MPYSASILYIRMKLVKHSLTLCLRTANLALRKGKQLKKNQREKARAKTFKEAAEKQSKENAAFLLLAEGELNRQYHKKRLAQAFKTPQTETPPKQVTLT